jgi:hypothetical protein
MVSMLMTTLTNRSTWCLQVPARTMLKRTGYHPLTITLVAPIVHRRGPCKANTWFKLIKAWDQEDKFSSRIADSEYEQPLLAYKLSCDCLDAGERHLLGALRFFPPATHIPAAALETVWLQCNPALRMQEDFADLLDGLVLANIVDQQPFCFHFIECAPAGAHSLLSSILEVVNGCFPLVSVRTTRHVLTLRPAHLLGTSSLVMRLPIAG